jgi:hypothetical protein
LPQLSHLLLCASNPFLELTNALYGLGPGVLARAPRALHSGGARGGVSAGPGEHLLDRDVQGASYPSERIALGVGWPPFPLDPATPLAQDLEPHPRDAGAFSQLPDGQSSVLAPLLDPFAKGLPGCFIHVVLAEVVRLGSAALDHEAARDVIKKTMWRRLVSIVVDK